MKAIQVAKYAGPEELQLQRTTATEAGGRRGAGSPSSRQSELRAQA